MAQLSELILENSDLIQSAYLLLDAAGSDNSDGSARGVHLRWDFLRSLGLSHLPKGNLAAPGGVYQATGTSGFNKPDDYVQIFRTPYIRKFPAVVDFSSDRPVRTTESGSNRFWEFDVEIEGIEHTDVLTTVIVRFTDTVEYDRVRNNFAPDKNPLGLMKLYRGVIEVEAKDKLSFVARIRVKQDMPAAGLTRIETISVRENLSGAQQFISIRQKYNFNSGDRLPEPTPDIPLTDDTAIMQAYCLDEYELMAENIHHVRFDYSNVYPIELRLETYSDFITGISGLETPWESVGTNDGKFALSVNDTEVFSRLEVPGVYDINNSWPRFYPASAPPSAGPNAFRVKTDNYKSKWTRTGGIKEGLITYLANSKDGSNATLSIVEEMDVNADEDLKGAAMNVSYLELLNIVSLDYHIARMLGLGHIDTNDFTEASVNRKYIYLASYKTYAPLESGQSGGERTHYYMTLPTGQRDYKKPFAPDAYLTKGIKFDQGVENTIMLTDEEGYVSDQRLRFININVNRKALVLPIEPFFYQDNSFVFSFTSETVYYGIEYRGEETPGVWETYYRVPKIHSDNEYFDGSSNKEVTPLLNAEQSAIYTHQEREEGNHQYAVYGVNWFSRTSDLGTPLSINTEFVNTYHLLPPVNLATQLIQEEDTLIFTSTIEQNKLQELIDNPSVTDPTLVRATFEINDVHHQNHQIVNKVQFFFKQNEPRSLAGIIKDVPVELAGKKSQVTTTSYVIKSDGSDAFINPVINSGDTSVFKGSVLATPEQQFFIEDIMPDPVNGNRAKIIVEQIEANAAQEIPQGSNKIFPVQTFIKPKQNDKFFIAENLQNVGNWNLQLAKEVDVINFSPASVIIANSSNNGIYSVITAKHNGRNTDIYVRESLPSATMGGDLTYAKKVVGVNMEQSNKVLIVKGELTEELSAGAIITIGESLGANGDYTVVSVQADDTNTRITVQQSIPAFVTQYSVSYNKILPIVGLHQTNKMFSVQGDVLKELQLTYTEVEYTSDGNTSVEFIGGLSAEATITALADINPGDMSGVFRLVFNTSIVDHPDSAVEWYKGIVRIPVLDPTSRKKKILEVIEIIRDTSSPTEVGPVKSPLEILVFDPTFDDSNYKILNNVNDTRIVTVNFHPGYRVYFRNETGFDKNVLLPAQGQGSKLTYFTARTVDTYLNAASAFSQPATIYAREIVPPLPPGVPTGPLFATRPDFYGKSTYTFDVEVNTNNRTPFGLVFYRANTRAVLDTIYKSQTVQQVIQDLSDLTGTDATFFTDRWNDLVNGVVDGSGLFKEYTSGGYRFPNPDNSALELPDLTDPRENPSVFPFNSNGSTTPGSVLAHFKRAVESAFVSMTERPVEYEAIRSDAQNGGRITRNSKPVIKNRNGEFIFPPDPAYDPAPMAVKYSDGSISKVRFTDYTLEGSSNEVYFYYGVEISNDLKFSDRSPIAGPIKLVDAFPADPPTIKSVFTQLANPIESVPTAVRFEVDTYLSGERIKKYQLYRAIENADALSVRTMKPVREFVMDEESPVDIVELVDDFSDEPFPLYGEALFYRVVALREITNERDALEFIPSQPSNTVLASIVDVVNPEAPDISFEAVEETSFPRRLTSIVLKWNKTTHNGTYYLFKMSSSGNYSKIAEINSNDAIVTYALSEDLIKVDEDGNEIFHRFKVDVENSSGLLNLQSKEKTI